jgi:predicted RNA-binding Zn ribbon-like protein
MTANQTPPVAGREALPARAVSALRLIGGRPCLDFVNTLAWRGTDRPNDRLADYAALLAWSRRAGLVSAGDAKALRRQAATGTAAAEATLMRARELREALHHLFTDATDIRPDDLARLNAELARAPERQQLARRGEALGWLEAGQERRLDRLLWPIAWSAADLLVDRSAGAAPGSGGGRIKACANADCGALFYDASRNRSRRWCVMEDCGNRAKARRHYARRKGRAKAGRKARGARPTG